MRWPQWLSADGTYVEFAGMLDDPKYFERFETKKSLAAASEIRLLVLAPIDLNALDLVFKEWIPLH